MRTKFLHAATILCLLIVGGFISCKKDIKTNEPVVNTPPGNPNPIPAATRITGSVTGLVVDENSNPKAGASVNIGGTAVLTDARGMFSFNNVFLDKFITTVTVSSTGYYKAFRSFSANATRNFVTIKLIQKTLAGTVSSSLGGTTSLSNGTQLSLPGNGLVVKSSGAPYSGTVNVYASYIDPTSADIRTTVPGSFMGKDGTNIYALSSAGMIAVELEGDLGQPLQLASNSPATIKLPIPSSLLGKAPASIDTWSLDDQGVWKKEGSATRSGDFYTMQVSHFSFWNCDVPTNSTYLTIHLQDQNGHALPNTLVELTIPNSNSWWATTYGHTDSLGNVSGIIPAAIELSMNVFPNALACATPIFTQTVGPFTTAGNITVTVTINQSQSTTITGTATDCNSTPLHNGTAFIFAGQNNYAIANVVDGNYTATLLHCSPIDTLNVIVVDDSTNAQGQPAHVSVTGSNVTVPNISACGGPSSALFTFDNSQGTCSTQSVSGVYQAGTALNAGNTVGVRVNVTVPGTYHITTTGSNGVDFSATGIFTSTGIQTVVLTGNGTPLIAGAFSFMTQALGMAGCPFFISFGNIPLGQANIDVGNPGACPNVTVQGSYVAGVQLNQNNTVTVTLNVVTAGTYSFTTNNGFSNGMSFQDSGTITQTGLHTFVLRGWGTPTTSGTSSFSIRNYNGNAGCSFTVAVNPPGTAANFSFAGGTGSCTGAVVSGPYNVGTPLDGQNTITLSVNVITAGTYALSTNATNGMSFSASGSFSSTGVQSLILFGSGTPMSPGINTFTPILNGQQTCFFTVQTN